MSCCKQPISSTGYQPDPTELHKYCNSCRAAENSQLHLLPYDTAAQQATQDYALETSFLRIITTPAIPRLSNNQEDDSGTGWKVMLST